WNALRAGGEAGETRIRRRARSAECAYHSGRAVRAFRARRAGVQAADRPPPATRAGKASLIFHSNGCGPQSRDVCRKLHASTGFSAPLAFRFVFASAPGIAAAAVLGISDVLVKIVAASHCDVLTMLSFRSVIGLAFMAAWLRLGGAPVPADARVRWISIGIGVLLTVLLYCLFEAIDLNDVSTAVLTYFVYPLLTGIAAAATGLERLRWQGIA